MGILLSLSPIGRDGLPRLDPNLTSALYLAITFAAYLVQRRPYISWRVKNRRERLAPWIRGLGIALLFQILAVSAAVPVYLLAASIAGERIA